MIGGDLAPQTDFMRSRDVDYEVIYLPERHPIRILLLAQPSELSHAASSRGARRSAQSPAVATRRAPSPSCRARPSAVRLNTIAVVSTDDLTPARVAIWCSTTRPRPTRRCVDSIARAARSSTARSRCVPLPGMQAA